MTTETSGPLGLASAEAPLQARLGPADAVCGRPERFADRSRASACLRLVRTGRILTPGTPPAAGQPDLYRHRAHYRDDDQPFGDWSNIVQVTARP